MPTVARRPAAQHQRDRLQARRRSAAELFATGVRQAEVARRLGVSRPSVHLWYQRWQAAGPDALHNQGPTGPAPRLSDSQLHQIEQVLLQGAGASGFAGELWTLDRITIVIERLTGAAASLCARAQPGPRLVVVAVGQPARQPYLPHPGSGGPTGRAGC